MLRLLFPVILAEIYQGSFYPIEIGYSAFRFSKIFQFNRHCLSSDEIKSGKMVSLSSDKNEINEKFATETLDDIKNLIKLVNHELLYETSAVILPFDQHPGRLEHYLAAMRHDLMPIMDTPCYSYMSDVIDNEFRFEHLASHYVVRVHLRRGDIKQDGTGANMYTPDEVIVRCLDETRINYPKSFVHLYSQGSKSWASDLLVQAGYNSNQYCIHTDESLWTNNSEVDHFIGLTRPCDLMIGSYSSYFRLACLFNFSKPAILVTPGYNGHSAEYADAKLLYKKLGAKFYDGIY
jgi:hypothetical protein